jgi:hypothetical protein
MKNQIIALSAFLFLSIISFGQDDGKLKPLRKDYKYGYAYDANNGVFTIPPKYDDALYFEEGLAPVKIGDKWGYINEQGVLVIPMKFDYANIFDKGYAMVGKASASGTFGQYKYGLINKAGVLVLPMKYDGLGDLEEGLISDQVGDKMGFINVQGVQVIPLKFDAKSGNMSDFANGFAKISVGNKFEYIDKTGKIICPPKYTQAQDFKEGMAMVGIDTNWDKRNSDYSKETNAWGFIDTKGKEVLPCKYEHVFNFENGFGSAQLDGYTYKIDKTGKIVDTIAKPAPKRVLALDSNTFTGKINKMGRVTIMYSGGYIQKVILNNMPVYNTSRSPINIDVKKMGLRAGSSATLKIIYTKSTTVKFVAGQGIE